jgi:hypothetical protein
LLSSIATAFQSDSGDSLKVKPITARVRNTIGVNLGFPTLRPKESIIELRLFYLSVMVKILILF